MQKVVMHKVVLQKALVLSLLTVVFTGGLIACGQKGPLYLPQQQSKPQPQVEPQPEVETAPAEKPAPVVAPEPNTDPS
ncbi:hypothetical protein O59_000062 [Cellvibrio sp. BR]|jgi:predicted small lipoprotein YifL|uniref:LPS translocon maturation chaperone LptM n=1 Tax=Cellvibrio sp. BR TaxID=1134474 RepID=UPI0002600FA5|nr:lipoprotein [Cellvibrio sp. BR]EIK46041.1 hypothetical protein O59_000062 [Cellvibrio sp. BR]